MNGFLKKHLKKNIIAFPPSQVQEICKKLKLSHPFLDLYSLEELVAILQKLNELASTTAISSDEYNVIGKTIVAIRYMTKSELENEGWENRRSVVALVLNDNTVVYASKDYEGNGPGAFFGTTVKNNKFCITVLEEDNNAEKV